MSFALDNLPQTKREQIAKECFTVQEHRGAELNGLCPAHEESTPSFSYNTEKDACFCLACGFKGDLVTLWAKAEGYGDIREAFIAFKKRFTDLAPSPGRGERTGRKGGAGSAPEVTKIIPETDWNKLPALTDAWRQRCKQSFRWSDTVIDRFDLRLRTVKNETRLAIPIRQDDGALVNIRLYLPGASENKLISWGAGYGKSKLFPAPSTWTDDPIILCEGEKDTITALSHGFNAVTQTAGVNSWDAARFNRFFTARKVIIAYDNDTPGHAGSQKVATSLSDSAASIAIIQWPACMQDKQDVTDWFTVHSKTAEEFKDLISDAKQIEAKNGKGRTRTERANEIPEEQRCFFVGKQFKARLCADKILEENRLAYDPITSMLYRWNGRHWEDIHEAVIRHRILNLLGIEGDTGRVKNTVCIVQDLSIIKHGRQFNDTDGLLPLQNGVLDITTAQLRNHEPDNLNTYCLDVSMRIDPANMPDCPQWKQFLAAAIGDPDTIRELQKFFGYCYTRETRHEKALLLIGPGGDGKGTIIKILRALLGEINCSTVGMSDMLDQFHRVMLVGKLLNSTTEIRSEVFQSDLLKQIISGEATSAAQKHKPAFSFNPVAKHIFSGNSYPAIKDHTDGLYRRLLIIEMDKQFATTGHADLYLYDKLLAERDAIFLWGLRGLQLLQKEGFTPSMFMLDCLDTFKQLNNPMLNFVRDNIEECPHGTFTSSLDIYNTYKTYCGKRGNQVHSLTNAMMMLQGLCPWAKSKRKIVKGNKFKGYTGLVLIGGIE